MPTNLPPDYFRIEERFRQADTVQEKIELLKEMMSVVPKHKGTEHLMADLRRRLARLNAEALSRKGGSKHDSAFRVPKAGAGQVVLAGPAGTGKSSLLKALTSHENRLTDTYSPTFEPEPMMMPFENIQFQLVDTPPLNREYIEPRLKELIRKADMVLVVVDLLQDPILQLEETIKLLEDFRVVALERKERYTDPYRLTFLPFLILVNKCDHEEEQELYSIFCELSEETWDCLPVSALTFYNLEHLKKEIYRKLDILRVYTKAPGKDPDLGTPFVCRRGNTLEDLAGMIHKDFLTNLKYARVWGKAVYDGQMVNRSYILQDGDVVEIHI